MQPYLNHKVTFYFIYEHKNNMYYLLKLLSLNVLVSQSSHNTIFTFEMLPKYVQPVTNPSG